MSESQDEVRTGLSLGVLIIGSLYWDRDCHRRNWRRDRLDQCCKRYVRAPIRYGRRSKTRGCSYTMVFSSGLGADDYGRAIVVPCSQRARNVADVVDEAVYLWTAETPTGKNPQRRVSAETGWGCVGLLPNPERPLPADVRAGWKQKVSREPCYGRLKAADNEDAAVDESGFLTIPWPESEDGAGLKVDVLLATTTNPTIDGGDYPSAQQVADAWNSCDGRDYVDYFCRNRAYGIKTFQDDSIQKRLWALWQQKGVPQS